MERNNNTSDSELIYGNDCPYIDILWESGKIFVSNATFRLIGKPSGIRLLWNAIKSILIIEPTDIKDPDGFPIIGQTYAKNGSLFIGSVTLVHEIWATTNWDKSLRYRIVAKYNESSNVAIFEMKNGIASEIPKNIRGGRPKRANSKKVEKEVLKE
jgi:hypothetical protein